MPAPLYWIVQDKVSSSERLVREDGAYWDLAEGSLLPWAKAQSIKLKKVEDTDQVREFEFEATLTITVTDEPDGRKVQIVSSPEKA